MSPYQPKAQQKTAKLTIHLSGRNRDRIAAKARGAGLTTSAYIIRECRRLDHTCAAVIHKLFARESQIGIRLKPSDLENFQKYIAKHELKMAAFVVLSCL